MRTTPESFAGSLLAAVVALTATLHAHRGPPFPIVSSQIVGAYDIAIWTDPDATDDAVAAGQFWIVLKPSGAAEIPADTRVMVGIRAIDRPTPELIAKAAPVDGLVTRQFAALRMDHEGPFAVRVAVDGPLGPAQITSQVDATYDLRPPPVMFVIYLAPFVVLGLVWVKLLRHRRALRRGGISRPGR